MAYLVLQLKDFEVKSYKISKKVIKIGRKPSNDVSLSDPFVSRDHAEIKALEDGGYLAAEDLSEKAVEIASLDAKKTIPFSLDKMDTKDVASLQRDHQRLMLLYDFGKAVNAHLEDQDEMLNEIMNAALKTLEAERGFIALVDENTGELACELVRSETGSELSEKLEVSRTIVHKVLNEGVSIMTVNAQEDTQFEKAKSIRQYNIRSAMCAPLLFRDEILGVVYLDNRGSVGSFSQDDQMFLIALCHQAGVALGNARLHRRVVQENVWLENTLKPKFQILGEAEKMKRVFDIIKKVAPTNITVLVQGETGTGKELVAKAIHTLSPRREFAFVPVNCAAIPKELIESELFGHEKGAFTGATSAREGKFQSAHGGTIFLDEIGDMSLDLQAKVLRILEDRELQRVGGNKSIPVDVRIIAATNKDLAKAVEEGTFREDLFYRLNVVAVNLPLLKERKKDIIPLAEYFIAGRVKKISSKAKRLMESYDWPGNVRELRNCVDRAVVLGDGKVIQPEDLPYTFRKGGQVIPAPLERLDHMEEDHIVRVLRYTNWNKSDAARILGITRQTLDNKIKRYAIKK